ncbi:MAG TPA: DNA gyrase inhibitor YacG [Vicinamibacterales bacterium]|nr:DNA gyrase inhibitor YacG [Vicinamibacterales bacterium]
MADPVCVYCRRRPVDPRWQPFCSDRCKLADLGRWLSGDYRVPADDRPVDEDEPDDHGHPEPD